MEYDSTIRSLPSRYRGSIRLLDKHPDKDFAFPILAYAFKGSRLVSYAFNAPKTDPLMKRIVEDNNIKRMYDDHDKGFLSQAGHAEVRCIKNCPTDFDTMVVVRKTKNGLLSMAKPCNVCSALIKSIKVKRVYYSTPEGFKQMVLG